MPKNYQNPPMFHRDVKKLKWRVIWDTM